MTRFAPRCAFWASLFCLAGLAACAGTTPPPATGADTGAGANANAALLPPPDPESDTETVAIPNARQALPGVITGGKPDDAQLQQAQAAGYHTVVSLLPDAAGSPEEAAVKALGMRFVAIPIAGAADLTEDNARKLGEVLSAPDARPLILHCGSGNRAGALLALYAHFVEGRPTAEAMQVGIDAGLTTLQPEVRQRLDLPPAP